MNSNIEEKKFDQIEPEKVNKKENINDKKRDFLKLTAAAAGGCCGLYALVKAGSYMAVSQDSKAEATTEADISSLKAGETITVVWRGRPVFIRNRTPEEIEQAIKDDKSSGLKDKQTDLERTKPGKENILVVIGICTHLGCVPIGKSNVFNGGEFGGWFCPCHGSHYDIAGRIRKGPAPTNLEIPPYKFLSDTKILIGES
jgi:ubiquinol-cytochrome c reductase iron-sulfur subunit